VLRTSHRAAFATVTRLSAAVAAAICIEIAAAAAWLTYCELRQLPFRRLALGARQRRADQPPMHGAVVITGCSRSPSIHAGIAIRFLRLAFSERIGRGLDGRFVIGGVRRLHGLFVFYHIAIRLRRTRTTSLGRFGGRRAILTTARRGNSRLLVLMVRVARRAARLLHLIVDHRHDGVIGDAALARTVVVQNVTEPKPALLH
jgi:hypothetical protein